MPGQMTTETRAFGAAIRELRARRRLTQERLGFECLLHRNYVGAMERGEINPTLRSMLRLAQGLDVSLTEMFEVFDAQRSYAASKANRSPGARNS